MANKIPWYITWDWKSAVGIVVVLLIIMGLIGLVFIPEIIQKYQATYYHGKVDGYIISVKENTMLREGRYGNRLIIESYKVAYSYKLDEQTYKGSIIIKGTKTNGFYLDKMAKNKFQNPITIKYDLEELEKSVAVLDWKNSFNQ